MLETQDAVKNAYSWPYPAEGDSISGGEQSGHLYSNTPSLILIFKITVWGHWYEKHRVPFNGQGAMHLLTHSLVLAHPGSPRSTWTGYPVVSVGQTPLGLGRWLITQLQMREYLEAARTSPAFSTGRYLSCAGDRPTNNPEPCPQAKDGLNSFAPEPGDLSWRELWLSLWASPPLSRLEHWWWILIRKDLEFGPTNPPFGQLLQEASWPPSAAARVPVFWLLPNLTGQKWHLQLLTGAGIDGKKSRPAVYTPCISGTCPARLPRRTSASDHQVLIPVPLFQLLQPGPDCLWVKNGKTENSLKCTSILVSLVNRAYVYCTQWLWINDLRKSV